MTTRQTALQPFTVSRNAWRTAICELKPAQPFARLSHQETADVALILMHLDHCDRPVSPPARLRTLPETTLSPTEERARLFALKGYLRARDGHYDRAQENFVRAITLDPALDLTAIPRFWSLPRAAHETAVAALECLGRNRDAARLSAIIERRFRPKLVRTPASIRRLT